MLIKKVKRLCALGLTVALGTSLLVGCGGTGFNTAQDEIVFNLQEDPKTIDPQLNTASGAGVIILNAFEGLTRVDENGKANLAGAEKMDVSEDGLVYTFDLRKDAKWSDGQAVTAKDYEYAWIRALDPATKAEYAYQLYYIKNAEEFNTGKAKVEDLGIKVIDDYKLEVTLNAPTTYFDQLLAFATYQPVRKDVIDAHGEKWARSAETYISNGAFKMVEWKDKESIRFEKNENYWDAANVKLNKLDFRLVSDETTGYAEFKAGNFDMTNSIHPSEIEAAVSAGDAKVFTEFATYFLCFNVGNNVDQFSKEAQDALKNPKFRKALSLAIDRESIVKNITKGEQVPAHSFTAPGIKLEDGKDFTDTKYIAPTGDLEAAKAMLAEAGYPEGKGLPVFNFLINSEGAHEAVAQYLADVWGQMGVKVEIQKQEFKVFLDTRQNGNYMIGRHGWSGDYVDPITFLDMWVTGGGNNEAGYSNPEYDNLIKEAKSTADMAKKYELLQKAEEILMNDLPIVPLYYYTKVRAINPAIKDLVVTATGKIDFKTAHKE